MEDVDLRVVHMDSRDADEDMRWAHTNPDELRPYCGKWIGIYQKRVIAGDDVADIVDRAERLGLPSVFIYRVPDDFDREVYEIFAVA
jgi:hypothetical protein